MATAEATRAEEGETTRAGAETTAVTAAEERTTATEEEVGEEEVLWPAVSWPAVSAAEEVGEEVLWAAVLWPAEASAVACLTATAARSTPRPPNPTLTSPLASYSWSRWPLHGLKLVHVSAQPEPYLTQNTSSAAPNTL